MVRKSFHILIFAVLIASCSSWNNFRAYYNTFYNAKKSFRAGLNKVQKQDIVIDPVQPVLIHQTPLSAGSKGFEEAAVKGTQLLQKFSDSKWVDDALLLTGKSYYYLHEFYPALQKFEDLSGSSSPEMKKAAVLWKGKTLLALKRYSKGANYLEDQLNDETREANAELQVLAAEHYVMQGNWDRAARWLSKAVNNIDDEKLLGRTFFLYGQVLERLQRYGEAYYAFSRAADHFPGFEYAYWASVKQADVARKQGNMDSAISIYRSLRKDDKNVQRRDKLIFEIARTLEMKGQTRKAILYYKSLLKRDVSIQRQTRAHIYYRLGKVNSELFNNYEIAAVYFDSSSVLDYAEDNVAVAADAHTLAKNYGKFTKLRKRIQRADSLLWLGSLSPSELDSAIKQITSLKRARFLEQQEVESERELLNRSLRVQNDTQSESSVYGFLNYRNVTLVNRGKAEFRVIWGDRSPVDNWRRLEAVQESSSYSGPYVENRTGLAAASEETAEALVLNVGEIPDTIEERRKLQLEKATAQYEIGNLLFLSLNSPDNARIYFHRVIKNAHEEELRAKAMYSLYELFNTENNIDSLKFWKHRILKLHPGSKYAQRIYSNQRYSVNPDTGHSLKLITTYRQILNSEQPNNASRLRTLAIDKRSSDLAPRIFYEAIKEYIRRAKNLTKMNYFIVAAISSDSEKEGQEFNFPLFEMEKVHFSNAYWDSVYITIDEFDKFFANTVQSQNIAKLRELLPSRSNDHLATCKSLGMKLKVEPNMKVFLRKVKFPERAETLKGNISYSFIIKPNGEIISYKLLSNRTSLGIEEALEAAFDQLSFSPVAIDNQYDKISCEVDFEIDF